MGENTNTPKKKSKIWIPIVIAAAVVLLTVIVSVVIVLIVIGVFMFGKIQDKKLEESLNEGYGYLLSGNYESAIQTYDQILKKHPKCEAAYNGMALAFEFQGEYDAAKIILEKGYDKTKSDYLKERIDDLEGLVLSQETNNSAETEPDIIPFTPDDTENDYDNNNPGNDDWNNNDPGDDYINDNHNSGNETYEDCLVKREELASRYGLGYDEGEVIYDFSFYDEYGNTVHISDFAGKAVYINFFATWCSYCNYEMPDIEAIKDYYGDDLDVIIIDMDENPSDVKKFAKQNGIDLDIYYLYDWYADGLNIDAIPVSIVIDKYGYITGYSLGAADYNWMDSVVYDAIYTKN